MARGRNISVAALRHRDKRRNLATAELEPLMEEKDKTPIPVPFKRDRNCDLDPQLVWRGKDEQDWSDLIVQAPPLYIQEKVHPKVLIDDLLRQSRARRDEATPPLPDLFADFNGLPDKEAVTEFYQHDANWSNRMILGDSLSVMASLAEREGLGGKVQCIYIDPPYGIRFNSNFQWSTTSRDVKDGNKDRVTREPEQVKAFRDTWRDGIHSYLTYLRDRLTVARDLLTDSGSIFVQIGDENVHRVRRNRYVLRRPDFTKSYRARDLADHRSWRSRARSNLWLWHDGLCRGTVGTPVDNDRHLARGNGTRAGANNGRALPLLSIGRQSRRATQGSRGQPHAAEGNADTRRHPPRIYLRARSAHHAEVDCKQCRDRRDLGEVASNIGAAARPPQRSARPRRRILRDSRFAASSG
jgi:hypothetical protein